MTAIRVREMLIEWQNIPPLAAVNGEPLNYAFVAATDGWAYWIHPTHRLVRVAEHPILEHGVSIRRGTWQAGKVVRR